MHGMAIRSQCGRRITQLGRIATVQDHGGAGSRQRLCDRQADAALEPVTRASLPSNRNRSTIAS